MLISSSPQTKRMATNVTFRSYVSTDKSVCLKLFDANCPEFFAPNERVDYAEFLDASPFSCVQLMVKS